MFVEHATLTGWGLELVAQGYSNKTIRAKTSAVRLAAEHAGVEAHQLTRQHVLAWIGAGERATWTRLKYLSHVRAWCAWAGIPDATADVRRPRMPAGIPRPVDEGDLAKMLLAAKPGKEQAWIVLGAYAGLRSFETSKVRAGDLVVSGAEGAYLRVEGKGGQLAVVPASPIVVDVLLAASEGVAFGDRLWPDNGAQAVQRAVRRVAVRAGVRCSSHQLRHRYGTALQESRGDLLLTQRLMRHASPATTAGYAKLSDRRARTAVTELPGARGLEDPPTRDEPPRLYVVR